MKRILFDLVATQPSDSSKRHGGGKYGEIVFFRLIERGIVFDCVFDSRRWLNPEVENALKFHGCKLHDIAKDSLISCIERDNYQTIYSALPSEEILNIKKCEVIGTLHGLRTLETPIDNYFWKYPTSIREKIKWIIQKLAPNIWKKRMRRKYEMFVKNPCRIVTVSNHSRASIMSYFPECKKDIKVFFSPNTSLQAVANKDNSRGDYFLMVSGNRWEKNNLRAILAFDRLVTAGLITNKKVVVTGCRSGMFDKRVQNRSCFEFLSYVDETELESLYANAYCFVYPSLNEGFGYPPLEAMRYGVPVIASPFSSISELLGGSVLYFNPLQIEEIMSRMLLISIPENHEKFSKAGMEKYNEIKIRQDCDLDGLIDYIIE